MTGLPDGWQLSQLANVGTGDRFTVFRLGIRGELIESFFMGVAPGGDHVAQARERISQRGN